MFIPERWKKNAEQIKFSSQWYILAEPFYYPNAAHVHTQDTDSLPLPHLYSAKLRRVINHACILSESRRSVYPMKAFTVLQEIYAPFIPV